RQGLSRMTTVGARVEPGQSHSGACLGSLEGDRRRRFCLECATPLQKTPQISAIFKADSVTLHVSQEKDGKLRLVYAGWDDTKVVQPDGCGQARRGGRADPTPWQGGAMAPPQKLGPPSGPPGFFQAIGAARVHRTVHFSPSFFDVSLSVTAPSVMRNGRLDHLVCVRQEHHPFTAAQQKSVSTAVNSMVNVTTTFVVVCKSCVLQTWPEASATSPSGPVRAESAK